MIVEPQEVEEYEHDEIYFRVYKFEDRNVYWLRIGGCCGLELKDKQLNQLHEFLTAYMEEKDG